MGVRAAPWQSPRRPRRTQRPGGCAPPPRRRGRCLAALVLAATCCCLPRCLPRGHALAAELAGAAAQGWWALCGGEALRRALLVLPVALVAGFSMGSLGFGAGILSINGMVYMPGLRMSQLEAVANSVAAQCVSANAAGGQWLRSGYCDLTVAACLGICGLPGAALGAQLARELSDATLRLLSAGMMCLVLCPLALSQLYTSRTQPSAPRAAIGDGDPEGRGDEESATFQGKKFPSGGCPAERPPAPCASSGGDPRDRGAEGSGASRGKTRPGGHGLAESQAILLHCAVGGAVGVVTSWCNEPSASATPRS
ncbi:unnamed protein product [Prorocentrum cordatum]|uniref:Uncharacterized protein n=1 Tax=Prorocentrum cordatum TaxID=2364126 RepID=A0ABN9PI62_9DINO|nr:unnamed protein product [Polarella glacialis]